MNKGFSRLWVRCNMVILSFAIVSGLLNLSRAQQVAPVPQLSPAITTENTPSAEEPKRIYQSACPALLNGQITATPLPPIVKNECGERSPLAVTSILAPEIITLSSTPQLNCRVATALVDWSTKLTTASLAAFDTQIKTILTGNGYQCRRRNNRPDGKISEHGFANAIDILGFKLMDGTEILVERHWGEADVEPNLEGLFLRTIHKQACGVFTTVLGPETNDLHKNHFHFDLGCHGKGCTYKVCE